MTRSVKGKSAVVTGAGSGINLEFARILLKNGCNVLFGDLNLRPEAQQLIDEYNNSSNGPKAVFHKTDVTSWSQLSSLFKTAEQHFGTFDIVCPGAGVFEPTWSHFWYPPGTEKSKDDPAGDHFRSLEINLTHPIRSTQQAIQHFLSSSPPAGAENPKTIVHISSIAGEMSFMAVPLYCAAKWGLRGFIYTMGELEVSHNVRVAGVAPAIVRTPIWLDAEDKRRMISSEDGQEQTEWVTPEEVAEVMYKICTEDDINNSKGDKIPLKGGSLIEVIHNDVRDVPIYGAMPPGSGIDNAQGLAIARPDEIFKDMRLAQDKFFAQANT